jgi:hypothetical protein
MEGRKRKVNLLFLIINLLKIIFFPQNNGDRYDKRYVCCKMYAFMNYLDFSSLRILVFPYQMAGQHQSNV